MEGAEPLPRRSVTVLPKLFTALPLITKRAQHPKNTQKSFFDKLNSLPVKKEGCFAYRETYFTISPMTVPEQPAALASSVSMCIARA